VREEILLASILFEGYNSSTWRGRKRRRSWSLSSVEAKSQREDAGRVVDPGFCGRSLP